MSTLKRRIRPRVRVTAQSMVEFALVLPIFLFVLFGIFEIGRMMIQYSSIANAAREGARLGVIVTVQPTFITGKAREMVVGVGPTPVVVMTATRGGAAVQPTARIAGDHITVSVSKPFQPLGFISGVTIPMSSSARMQVE